MHVIVIVQRIEKIGHFLPRGSGDFGEALGNIPDFRGDDVPAGAFQSL